MNSKLVDTVFKSSHNPVKKEDEIKQNTNEKNDMPKDHKELYSDSDDFGDDSKEEDDIENQNEVKLIV